MPAKTVNWDDGSILEPGPHTIYTKPTWSEYSTFNNPASAIIHTPWVKQDNLHCEQATWSLLPTMPSARLINFYGPQLPHAVAPAAGSVDKVDLLGHYVKIEFQTGDGTLKWFGIIQEQSDVQGGTVSGSATGRQNLVAYGLAQMYNHIVCDDSLWLYFHPAAGNDIVRQSGLGLTFNQLQRPNRTANKPTVEGAGILTHHAFSPTAADTRWHSAAGTPYWPRAAWWSSRDIFEYITLFHRPRDYHTSQEASLFAPARIPITISGLDKIPNWDQPTIQTEGRSALSVMQQICDPGRLIQFAIEVNDAGDNTTPGATLDEIIVHVHSLAPNAIENPPGTVIQPAPENSIDITAFAATDTSVTIQTTATRTARVLNVKGARAETVMTAKVVMADPGDAVNDSMLHEAWTTEAEDDYNDGNTTGIGDDDVVQSVNNASRKREKLADVYKSFIVAPNWNHYDKLAQPVFINDDGTEHVPYYNEMRMQSILPLREEVDYASAGANDDDDKLEFRKALVVFKDPFNESDIWLEAEKLADASLHEFAVDPNAWKDGMGIRLNVVGGPQHKIAQTRFVPNFVDLGSEQLADYEYGAGEMLITMSLQDDRYLTYQLLSTQLNLHIPDQMRTKNIYAGSSFRKIRVMDQTVVDVSSTNQLQFSQPGLTDADKYLHNEVDQLENIALIARIWEQQDRNIFRLSSSRPSSVPAPGDMLYLFTGNDGLVSIEGSISQITLVSPIGSNLQVIGQTYTIQTGRGEADLVSFLPQPWPQPRNV